MGLEAVCRVRAGGDAGEAKVHLDKDRLTARGALRLDIPLAEVQMVEARGGVVEIVWSGGRAELELGSDAERWRLKIRYPKGRLEKLGIKVGARVSLVGEIDPDFKEEVASTAGHVAEGKPARDSDAIFYAVSTPADLARLAELTESLKPAGAIWTIRRKGKAATVSEAEVMAAARAHGLVDVKVVSFSETHTAEKLVIRVANR